MTETLTAIDINCETGEITERPLSLEEISQHEANAAAIAELEAINKAKNDAKAAAKESGIAKLMALGLTEEEANALVK